MLIFSKKNTKYNNMKKFLTLLLVIIIGSSVFAAAKQKVSGITDNELAVMSISIDEVIRKMYSGIFLSPTDTSALIGIKLKLDDNMLQSPDIRYTPLYYKLGKIYQKRGKRQEAIECFQTIIENFPDTALAPKAAYELKNMGINIVLPQKTIEDEEE